MFCGPLFKADLFGAGTDTTIASIKWNLLFLAAHQTKQVGKVRRGQVEKGHVKSGQIMKGDIS